jgi:hypothetical protein
MDQLGITTLERRRIRGDLIQTYKLLNGIDKVTWTSEATFAIKDENDYSIKTRGHNMKLIREIVKSCEQRQISIRTGFALMECTFNRCCPSTISKQLQVSTGLQNEPIAVTISKFIILNYFLIILFNKENVEIVKLLPKPGNGLYRFCLLQHNHYYYYYYFYLILLGPLRLMLSQNFYFIMI